MPQWRLVADNTTLAFEISSIKPRLRHGITAEFVTNNAHSNSAYAAFGQRALSDSVLDWTAVHQDDVALVVTKEEKARRVIPAGAYGETAVLGRGKY